MQSPDEPTTREAPALHAFVRPLFTEAHPTRSRTVLEAVLLVVLCFVHTGLFVTISYAQRDFSTSLSGKDWPGFVAACWKFAGVIAVAAPSFAYYHYLQGVFCLHAREWLTERLLNRYYADDNFFHLSGASIDNPDQRITEDARIFVAQSVGFVLQLLSKLLNMLAFCGVLWSISPALVAILLAYSALGTLGTVRLFGSSIQRLAFAKLAREADLRFALVRAREHAESIAFFGGGAREERVAASRFLLVVETAAAMLRVEFFLGVFQNVYEYATFLVPGLVIAPRYMRGEVEFGVVTQASMAFGAIRATVSYLLSHYAELSQWWATVVRLDQLADALAPDTAALPPLGGGGTSPPPPGRPSAADAVGAELAPLAAAGGGGGGGGDGLLGGGGGAGRVPRGAPPAELAESDARCVVLEDVDVRPEPGRRGAAGPLLVARLSLALRRGERLLVMGPSGCGKSSLLRVLLGLWRGAGGVARCKQAFFLPQQPYMVLGTLKANVAYPAGADALSAEAAQRALEQVGLARLARWLRGADADAEHDWAQLLSAGEQQRLAMARLLLRRPLLALCDEASSALDEDNERLVYGALQAAVPSYVSVGHRPSLLQYHTHVLLLDGAGGWKLTTREEFSGGQ